MLELQILQQAMISIECIFGVMHLPLFQSYFFYLLLFLTVFVCGDAEMFKSKNRLKLSVTRNNRTRANRDGQQTELGDKFSPTVNRFCLFFGPPPTKPDRCPP